MGLGEVTEQLIDDILDRLFFRCRRRPVFYRWRPFLPDPKDDFVLEVAQREQISVERVVCSALAEQLNALERLDERAARSGEDRFRAALAKIPDVEPPEYDRLS